MSDRHVFGAHAAAYLEAGVVPIPVDAARKKPIVKGHTTANAGVCRGWISSARLATANGIGILLGASSGIVEVDVDTPDTAVLEMALRECGPAKIIIRTASGRWKLWYRHAGEGRHIRPVGDWPIDLLGRGLTLAPPTWREDLQASYEFVEGDLSKLRYLEPLKKGTLASVRAKASSAGEVGTRNNDLFRHLMLEAAHCDDLDALVDVAETFNMSQSEPLSTDEVRKCAASAWRYQASDTNFLGRKRPAATNEDRIMDALIDVPEALALYLLLRRWHKSTTIFSIAPRSMSEAGSPPWPRGKIAHARAVLVERGFLETISEPSKARQSAGRYRLALIVPGFGHNHYTPSPKAELAQRTANSKTC